jgi:outer membrane protein OmpA-like peptidoglycan-associated protein
MASYFRDRLCLVLKIGLTLAIVVSAATVACADDCKRISNILVLFDASGFMKEKDHYQRLLEQMRFFERAIPLTADGVFNVGLRHYGLKVGMGCESTESILAVQPWDPQKFINAFPKSVSYGVSSLSAGLRAAAGDLAGASGKSIIVVVGGGVESCKSDPIKIADQICRNNPDLEIHTFQIGNAQDGSYYLKGIAQRCRGEYMDTNDVHNPAPWHAWMKRYLVTPCGPSQQRPSPETAAAPERIGPVTFDFNSFSVRSTDPAADQANRAALEATVKVMSQSPGVKLVLHGFSDGKGSPEYNMRLSRKRAQAVARELTTKYGIPAQRISIVPHGSTQSMVSSGLPERMGRRVEFELVQ